MHRFLLAALLVVPALPAAAQQQDEMISKRLVALLFPGFLDRLVEGLADDFPEDALPDGATALVSMSSPRNVMAVAEAPSFTLADRPRYERKLAAAGWTEGAGPMGGRGLTAPPFAVPTMFCRDDRMLSYTTQPRPGGGHHLRISVSPSGEHGPGREGPRIGTLEALALPGGDVLVTLRVIGPRGGRRELLP